MKILICCQVIDKNHPILGFFHGWVLEFSKHFKEVHVICLQKGVYDLPPHVFVYSLGKEEGESNLKYSYRFYKYFGKVFFKVRVDFVFFHMGAILTVLAAPFFFVRKFFGTQFYWWKAHGHINWFGRFALTFVDRVYTSTESGFPIRSEKRHIIGQAIDITRFVFPQSGERAREVIYVGRIVPIKRIEDFIEVARNITTVHPGFVFTVVGPLDDVDYKKRLDALCAEHGLSDKVRFVGSKTQEELVPLYQKASFFLNTSLTNSMDKTVLEAMLCGCIPVTANKAFFRLLSPSALYCEEPSTQRYTDVLMRVIEVQDTASFRKELRESVVKEHSLTTFPLRIFNT
jgi:glycosyltransferase involved in cell wall biosynthesis